ncbi:MAG: pyrophosphate--fructose-6-phosphate 1-phosphotransferase [Rhodothermales bacterium]|jgi:pyrophosphate--fructose-6-phosphate 1-phosphotransferase
MLIEDISELQKARFRYCPRLPAVFHANGARVQPLSGDKLEPSKSERAAIEAGFPNTYAQSLLHFAGASPKSFKPFNVGVILSGGQAPGGHNVIAGLYDALKSLNSRCQLIGFIGGPSGLLENESIPLQSSLIDRYRNTGGFDMIGSGRTKLETTAQFDKALETCRAHDLSALIIIGGDDSNTNACVLAEYYASIDAGVQVIGCPKTIDGDLKNKYIETSFGMDTACKVYSELIGNIGRDACSGRKYWHFVKLMGRSASHIALECALQTQPNVALISEEVAHEDMTLDDVVDTICDSICQRAEAGLDYGLVLIPEGLIEFIPAMGELIAELNDLLAMHEETNDAYRKRIAATHDGLTDAKEDADAQKAGLSEGAAHSFMALPSGIRKQLLLDRDPHGNVQVSRIETEKLLITKVKKRLKTLKTEKRYKGTFSSQAHFFGYEGRCAPPSNFDADYCYALGYCAAALVGNGCTGYIAAIRHLNRPAEDRIPCGVPTTSLMNMERRHGEDRAVIEKALVELDGTPFKTFADKRKTWAKETHYVYPGPIQYFGPANVCDQPTMTLQLEDDLG